MDAVSADLQGGDDAGLVLQPFGPAAPDDGAVDIGFGELDEKMIVSGLAFHESAVELPEIGVFEPLAEAFETLAASGFDQRANEQAIQKTAFFVAAFPFEFHQPVDILVFSLRPETETSFLQFRQYEAEVSPFFGDDGCDIVYKALPGRVALDQRDATGGGLLLAPGVIGEDVPEGNSGEIDPARVGGQLQSEDVLLGRCIHGVKLLKLGNPKLSVMRNFLLGLVIKDGKVVK